MKIETEPIEEIVNGSPKYAGIFVTIKHNGKVVGWRTRPVNPRDLVETIRTVNKMMQSMAKHFPYLEDKKTSEDMKKEIETESKLAKSKTMNSSTGLKKKDDKSLVEPISPDKLPTVTKDAEGRIVVVSKPKKRKNESIRNSSK